MALLDRKALLAKEKLEVTKVDLGDGNYVFVRQMTGRERDRFEQSLIKENKNAEGGYEKTLEDFRAKLAVCTVSDEDGNLIHEWCETPIGNGALSSGMCGMEIFYNKDGSIKKQEQKKVLCKYGCEELEYKDSAK